MVTYCISPDCVALLLSPGESVSVRATVASCLRSAGLPPWKDMEAELFSCAEGQLLFAHPRGPRLRRLSPAAPRLRRGGMPRT